ncbi:hypothetical protein [Herbiconiux ginsengi]|uniref:Uncharacterized protein n=1 Tax=Herbiconiux ginsengi TaxID=381665 RepID=A0A1H3TJN4_9MICO|nr:hypothetical protein [Herbiconiux ginsengi]SDZ50493.1 hypothetical protein SAMN05216554_4265 [Herbiconiux ginsengi]
MPDDGQSEPVMGGSDDATVVEKAEGIMAQVKADAPDASEPELVVLLRQRFADAGIESDDDDLVRMARWIAGDE